MFNKITDCIVKDLVLDYDVIGPKAAGMLADASSSDQYAEYASINNIKYSGIIKNESTNNESVGGLIGSASQTRFTDCVADGVSVEAKYSVNVGGLIGKATTDSKVSNSSFIINYVFGCDYVGGVVGYAETMMSPTLAENVRVAFDIIERSTQYKYNNTFIGGFSGFAGKVSLEDVVVVGNEIIGNGSIVGGFSGLTNGYGISKSAVAINKLAGEAVVSGFTNLGFNGPYDSYNGYFNNILVDHGVIQSNHSSGFLSFESDSNSATIERVTQHVREIVNDKSVSGELYGFSFYNFKYNDDGYSHESSVSVNMVSSAVDKFTDVSSSQYTKLSGFVGATKTGKTSYQLTLNNDVTMSNRPYLGSAVFNDNVSNLYEHKNVYYYLTSDNDTPFVTATSGDNEYKMSDSSANSVITKLNQALTSDGNCSDCEWILKSFHNNTSNKDVNLPYLKQQGLEDKLAAQKTAHCEAFGAKSKFCP